MKIKEKGRYFELPIAGLKIEKIIFTRSLTIVFDDDENSCLDFDSPFLVTQYNQTREINRGDKEAFILFYDHFNNPIKEAKADNSGNLWLTFSNGTEIAVEDGPYENWHYTKRSKYNPSDSLSVHGGVGRTVIIE